MSNIQLIKGITAPQNLDLYDLKSFFSLAYPDSGNEEHPQRMAVDFNIYVLGRIGGLTDVKLSQLISPIGEKTPYPQANFLKCRLIADLTARTKHNSSEALMQTIAKSSLITIGDNLHDINYLKIFEPSMGFINEAYCLDTLLQAVIKRSIKLENV